MRQIYGAGLILCALAAPSLAHAEMEQVLMIPGVGLSDYVRNGFEIKAAPQPGWVVVQKGTAFAFCPVSIGERISLGKCHGDIENEAAAQQRAAKSLQGNR